MYRSEPVYLSQLGALRQWVLVSAGLVAFCATGCASRPVDIAPTWGSTPTQSSPLDSTAESLSSVDTQTTADGRLVGTWSLVDPSAPVGGSELGLVLFGDFNGRLTLAVSPAIDDCSLFASFVEVSGEQLEFRPGLTPTASGCSRSPTPHLRALASDLAATASAHFVRTDGFLHVETSGPGTAHSYLLRRMS